MSTADDYTQLPDGRWKPRDGIEAGQKADSQARDTQEPARGPSQADLLVETVSSRSVELFHDVSGEAYAVMPIQGHRETWPVQSADFRRWLRHDFYRQHRKTPNAAAVADAIGVIEGRAEFEGAERPVWVRVAEGPSGAIYVDLGDPSWAAVQVTADGWDVVPCAPVHFRRSPTTAALPRPVRGGSVGELKPFVNVAGENDFRLIVAWLIGALRPFGPYPILALLGEHGSAKSFMARVLRAVIDPAANPVRCMPREARDVLIGARHNQVLAYDNLSSIPDWFSDLLCGLATGTSGPVRALYTNDEEKPFLALRPLIISSIDDVLIRGDLVDRSIITNPPAIARSQRRSERKLWGEFEAARPRIFGAVLNAVVAALRNQASVALSDLPRMADFAEWVVAAEEDLPWPAGGFMVAYGGNIEDASALALEASPIAALLREVAAECGDDGWSGTAADLLDALNRRVPDDKRRRREWPSSPKTMSNAVRRIAPNLRAVGVDVVFDRERRAKRRRLIFIRPTIPENTVQTVHSVHAESGEMDGASLRVDDTPLAGDGDRPPPGTASESAVDGVDEVDGSLQASIGDCIVCGSRSYLLLGRCKLCEKAAS